MNLEKINIPRCYVPADFGHVVRRELHHFSDASTYGHGQCSYLRHVNEDGSVHCALVIGKSRVAPIKVITIPRLELTAAVVSVEASNILKEELVLTDIDECLWTDSKVVLGYISNEARRFHTFVSNRIQKIPCLKRFKCKRASHIHLVYRTSVLVGEGDTSSCRCYHRNTNWRS